MKSRDTLIRLKRFQVEEKRRRVRQIEMMIAEFTRMIGDLDREIANEEKRAGISDPRHFAYPTYARAAAARRDNLKSSIAELAAQIEEAKAAQDEAQAEVAQGSRSSNRARSRAASERPRARCGAAMRRRQQRDSSGGAAMAQRRADRGDLRAICAVHHRHCGVCILVLRAKASMANGCSPRRAAGLLPTWTTSADSNARSALGQDALGKVSC